MKTRFALLCLLFIAAVTAPAATVRFAFTNYLGDADTNWFLVYPVGDVAQADGSFITKGPAVRLTPNASGLVTNRFEVGNYIATNRFLGRGIAFRVPNDHGPTVYCATCGTNNTPAGTGLAISGYNTFVTVTYGTNPPPTYDEITNSLGYLPTSPSTATNIAAYQAQIATNSILSAATNIAAYQAQLATNAMLSGAQVTNAAAYQAKIATNGLTPVTLVDGVNSQIAQPSPGVYQVNVTGTGTATNVIDVAAGANVSIVSNALLRTISVPGANPSSLTNFESRKVYLSNGLDITNLNNSFRVMTADGVVQFQQVLNETGVRFTKATGDGSGITNITQAGVVGLVNGLTYLTNVAAFSNNNLLFVDLNGSDSNPGTKSAPFKTIQAAKAASSYGTLIVVGAGSNFITTSVIAPPGGGVVGVGPSTHIWSTNNLTLHGPMFVPSDNSYLGNFTLHSDAPFGSYEDVSVGAVPTHATNWVLENFTIWGRPTKYRNIDGIVFSAGLTNQGIIRNGTIAGGYDAFSFRDNELGDPGTYDVLIQNVVCDIKVPNGTANTARGFNIRRINPSRFQLQNVVFYMTNANVAADSSVINVVDNTTSATTIDLDNVRYVNAGGSNDVVLASAVTLNISGGNLPDARFYNPLGAPVQYSFRNGQSLTNIQQLALAYAAGSAGNVLTYTSSNTAAWLPSSSYQYNFTNASFYPTNGDIVRLAQTIRGNTLQVNNTTNYLGTSGAGLFSTVGDPNSDLFTFNDIDEFTGGIITRWNGHAGARTFEVVTPNFYANGQYLTNIARTGVTGLEAALSYLTNNTGGGAASGAWNTNGNSGLPAGSFIGTTDNASLIEKSFGVTLANLSGYSNTVTLGTSNFITGWQPYSVIGGGRGNSISGVTNDTFWYLLGYNTISGGATNTIGGSNVGGDTIGGGLGNVIYDGGWDPSTISGGEQNSIYGAYGTVGGGARNAISSSGKIANFGTIAGGSDNSIVGISGVFQYGSILGGRNNTVSNDYATVIGGYQNYAAGSNSLAGGYNASATHPGSFVWSDVSSSAATPSVGNNTFNVRATGGAFFSGGLTAAGTITGNGAGVTNIAPTSITPRTGTGGAVLSNTPTLYSPTVTGTLLFNGAASAIDMSAGPVLTDGNGSVGGTGAFLGNQYGSGVPTWSFNGSALTNISATGIASRTGNGAVVLSNTPTVSGITLSGITTNSGGWVGGLNMTNPTTGSFVVMTNGGITAQSGTGYNISTNGVVALGANAAAAKITLDGVNGNITNGVTSVWNGTTHGVHIANGAIYGSSQTNFAGSFAAARGYIDFVSGNGLAIGGSDGFGQEIKIVPDNRNQTTFSFGNANGTKTFRFLSDSNTFSGSVTATNGFYEYGAAGYSAHTNGVVSLGANAAAATITLNGVTPNSALIKASTDSTLTARTNLWLQNGTTDILKVRTLNNGSSAIETVLSLGAEAGSTGIVLANNFLNSADLIMRRPDNQDYAYFTVGSATTPSASFAGIGVGGTLYSSRNAYIFAPNAGTLVLSNNVVAVGTYSGSAAGLTNIAHGIFEASYQTNGTASSTTQYTWTQVANNLTLTSGLDSEWVVATNALVYTGSRPRMIHMFVTVSATCASPAKNVKFALAKSGTRIVPSETIQTIQNAQYAGTALHPTIAMCSTGDAFQLYINNDSDSGNVTIVDLNMGGMYLK